MKRKTQFSDAHLLLLCLDFLIDLRRNNDAHVLNGEKHLDADCISLAAYALMRSILRPEYLANKSSDNILSSINFSKITEEVLKPSTTIQRPYDTGYKDLHPSNLYRFFEIDGLAGGPDNGPLLLADLVEAGLNTLKSRCRLEAEKDIVRSTQFELYIQSVTNRGFFNDPVNSGKRRDPKEEEERKARKSAAYKEKYRKAIAKYREKLAGNVMIHDITDISVLSPPNSPPVRMKRSDRAFSSPPRTCQTVGSKEGPLSPLTPNSNYQPPQEVKTPPPPHELPLELQTTTIIKSPSKKTPLKTPPPPHELPLELKTTTIIKSPSKKTPRKKTSSVARSSPIRSNLFSHVLRTPVRTRSSTSATSTPVRFASSTPMKFVVDSPSAKKTTEPSPQLTVARPRGSQVPKELPLDGANRDRNRSHSRSASSGGELESQNDITTAVEQPAATNVQNQSPPSSTAPEGPTKSFDPSGFSPVGLPQPTKSLVASPTAVRRSLSPKIEVKVKAFSPYELNLAATASSGLELNGGSFYSFASPKTRRRKSEYEKKIEQPKRWTYPASLALPDMADSVHEEEEEPLRKGRPKSIITSRGQETKKAPKTPKANASTKHAKVETGRTSDSCGVSHHPRSPVAQVRKSNEELQKLLRLGEASSPVHNSEEAISPCRSSGLNEVCREDTSWIAGPNRPTKGKEDAKKPKERNLSFGKKASAFHGGTKPSFGNRMPTNSPKAAELKIDPFRITPPKFLGTSRLRAATIGPDSNSDGNREHGSARLSSPRAGLRPSPRNFNSTPIIKRAC